MVIGLAEANKLGGFKRYPDGSLVVHGNVFASGVNDLIDKHFGVGKKNIPQFPLVICDPPYGIGLKNKEWDDVAAYENWFLHCEEVAAPSATICMWGGVGKPGHRPFLEWVSGVEKKHPDWEGQFVTWKKRRAYGTATKYLFTREECFILIRGTPTFNKPYLSKERGYAGFDKAHPALSKYLRRGLVWDDVTEMFKGKIHPAQKPTKLYEILVQTHSNEGDIVYDPCAGSGTTARACKAMNRRFVIVEEVRKYLEQAKLI
jgi:site-specific DNA-methyltransferase (adenine-specific)